MSTPRDRPTSSRTAQKPLPGMTGRQKRQRRSESVSDYYECPACGTRYETLADFDNRRCTP